MLIVTGYLYVAPAELARFMAHLKALAATTRRRDGNISYDAAVDHADAGRLIVLERWVDQAALTAHLNADETVQFVNQWSGRMRTDIRKYDVLNERDLMED